MHKKKWPHCLCSLTVLFWLVSFILISFYLQILTFDFWLSIPWWFDYWLCYFPFVCGFCCRFVVVASCKKPPLTSVPTYRVPCPLGPSHSLFLCPPVPYYPTTPIHIIRGHPCTFDLVCVCFLRECVHMCVCCHKLTRCVRVCLLTCLVYICVC